MLLLFFLRELLNLLFWLWIILSCLYLLDFCRTSKFYPLIMIIKCCLLSRYQRLLLWALFLFIIIVVYFGILVSISSILYTWFITYIFVRIITNMVILHQELPLFHNVSIVNKPILLVSMKELIYLLGERLSWSSCRNLPLWILPLNIILCRIYFFTCSWWFPIW